MVSLPPGDSLVSFLPTLQANKTPLRALDPIRLSNMNCGPDFTPSFANLGRPTMGSRGGPVSTTQVVQRWESW